MSLFDPVYTQLFQAFYVEYVRNNIQWGVLLQENHIWWCAKYVPETPHSIVFYSTYTTGIS